MVWAVGKCLERVWCHGIHSNVPNQSAGDDGCIEKGKMRDMTLLHSPQLIQAPLTSQEDPENLRKAPTPPLHFVALLYYACIHVIKLVCREIYEHYSNVFKVYTHNINRYVYILI